MTNTETIKNLPDLIQFWLQGQVNDCVAGHLSRIERLEDRIQTQDAQIKALSTKLEAFEAAAPAAHDYSAELFKRAFEYYLVNYPLEDHLSGYDVMRLIEEELEEKIKKYVGDLDFEVRVS